MIKIIDDIKIRLRCVFYKIAFILGVEPKLVLTPKSRNLKIPKNLVRLYSIIFWLSGFWGYSQCFVTGKIIFSLVVQSSRKIAT